MDERTLKKKLDSLFSSEEMHSLDQIEASYFTQGILGKKHT